MSGWLRRDTAVLSFNHVAKANTYLSLHCVTIEKLRREKIRIFGRLWSVVAFQVLHALIVLPPLTDADFEV